MPFTLQDWFCMNAGRSSFLPRIPEDAELIFCHDAILQNDILASIEKAFSLNEPVKMLLYGDWGVGKTHLLYHICWWLEQNQTNFPAKPVVIEIGDLTRASRFDEVVRPFLDRLGLDAVIQLVQDYRGVRPNLGLGLREAGVAAHVAEAFAKLLLSAPGSPPAPLVVQAFEYLKGRNIGRAAAAAGLAEPLEQSRDFYDVLLSLGEMYRTVHNCRLLFIADEAAKLEAVEDDMGTQQHWVTVNKLIFSNENRTFGFIYTISGRRNDLPSALWEPQIQNRLGDNAFELANLATADVETYLRKLIESFVDQGKVQALVTAGTIPAGEYDAAAYPFTAAAKQQFLEYFNRTQENAKPRDISNKLNDVAFIAGKKQKRLIDEECLRAKNM
jgi:hypothetical protein